jgi:hypothetical protein
MGNCIKICRNGRFLVKIGDDQGALHMKIYMPFWYYIEYDFWNVYRKEDSFEQKLWIRMKNRLHSRHFLSFEFKGKRTSWDERISWLVYSATSNALPNTHNDCWTSNSGLSDTYEGYSRHPHLWRALFKSASPSVDVYEFALANSKMSNWFLNKILNWILRKTVEYFRLYLYQSTLMPTLHGVPHVFVREPRAYLAQIFVLRKVFLTSVVEKNLLYVQQISL